MGYSVKVLADSVSPVGVRLTTMVVTFPRIVLAEFNTHRVLSRNSASSRAIPILKRIAAVWTDPFVPEAFGSNKAGMQAGEALTGLSNWIARSVWMGSCYFAIAAAWLMSKLKVHKQLANRLLEPFLWHAVIVTATEWDNFFALRCHPDAQPEIRRLAEMMRAEYETSTPREHSEWHLPLVDDFDDLVDAWHDDQLGDLDLWRVLCLISIGRCARVSYLTHDGRRDPLADMELAVRLQASGHMSPFEHAARPLTVEDAQDIVMKQMKTCGSEPPNVEPKDVFCGNFCGWLQYRKTLADEDNFKRVLENRAK